SVHLSTKAHHSRWTRVQIQVRIEVGKTIQHVTEVKIGVWKRYAGSKPQYSGVQRFGAQTSGNSENPHASRMTRRAAPIRGGKILAPREYRRSAAGYKAYARFPFELSRRRLDCRTTQYGKTHAAEPNPCHSRGRAHCPGRRPHRSGNRTSGPRFLRGGSNRHN